MTRTFNPNRPFPAVFHEPSLPVTKDQLLEIARSLHVGTGSEHVAAVLDTIRRFHGRRIAMAALPPGDHRDRDIETLSALDCAMDGLNSNVLTRLARYGIDLSACEPANVAAAARHAADELKQLRPTRKPGRPISIPNVSRPETFRKLAEIYTKATGNKATINVTSASGVTTGGRPSGPFFRFMRAAVAPVPDLKGLEDDGLASAVKRATSSKIKNK